MSLGEGNQKSSLIRPISCQSRQPKYFYRSDVPPAVGVRLTPCLFLFAIMSASTDPTVDDDLDIHIPPPPPLRIFLLQTLSLPRSQPCRLRGRRSQRRRLPRPQRRPSKWRTSSLPFTAISRRSSMSRRPRSRIKVPPDARPPAAASSSPSSSVWIPSLIFVLY